MSRDTLKKFYDDLYSKKPNVFGNSSLDFIKENIDVNRIHYKYALDVGAGEGLSSKYLHEEGFIVDSIDISNEAFSSIKGIKDINTFYMPIEEFSPNKSYGLIIFSLVAHHINNKVFEKVIEFIQNKTVENGINCYRIFTTESDFYKKSQKINFYDNGENLNKFYNKWNIIYDNELSDMSATENSSNKIREVVFMKN